MRERLRFTSAAFILAIAISGCSMKQDISAADSQMKSFHNELNNGEFDLIYNNAGQDFRNSTTPSAMTALLSAIHRKLGPFKSGKSVTWNDSVLTTGHFVQIEYSAQYRDDLANEVSLYRLDNGLPELAGYHITSNALILK